MGLSKNVLTVGFVSSLILFTSWAHAGDVLFETDVMCKKNNQDAVEVKSGTKMKLAPGDSLLAISRQNVPLLIVAPASNNANVTVSDSNFSGVLQDMMQPQLEAASNDIVDSLRRVDALLQKRAYNEAVQIVNTLKEKYHRISSVLFMSGTVHYLLNDKSTAAADLEKGLEIDSTNENAKRLLKKLKGGS